MAGEEGADYPCVSVIRTTDRALLCRMDPDPYKRDEWWVPRSVVHEDSEITSDAAEGDEGTLIVFAWFAEKEGRG